MHLIAIYDMDRTITRAATYDRFLLHAARRLAPWRLALAPLLVGPLAAYAARAIDRGRLKELSHRLLLGNATRPAALAPAVESFAKATLAGNVLPGALARIAADRAAGYRLVLATASYRLYAEAIGRALGFDDVIATGSRIAADGAIVARIDGENCYGAVKRRMVETWLAGQRLARAECHIRAYTDHVSDAPLLDHADEAFAVNAHDRLLEMARTRGWAVLDWR